MGSKAFTVHLNPDHFQGTEREYKDHLKCVVGPSGSLHVMRTANQEVDCFPHGMWRWVDYKEKKGVPAKKED